MALTVEFLATDDPEARTFASDIIGYLFGYAHLTNTGSLALVGDLDANAYELLFSFASSEKKEQFLELVLSNLDMGNDYIENDLLAPTIQEIKDVRPLATVLLPDVLNHAALIPATVTGRTQGDPAYRDLRLAGTEEHQPRASKPFLTTVTPI